MAVRGVTLGLAALLTVASCSGDGSASGPSTTVTDPTTTTASTTTTTAPERPASTTTTAFDPASVEGAVEAAYLRSWDVYADAVYNLELDESALTEVYAGKSLEGKLSEIRDRVADGRAALVDVEHRYDIVLVSDSQAQVIDRFVNHQVLIDPDTKQPVEEDPDELLIFNFRLELLGGTWRVTFIERVNP